MKFEIMEGERVRRGVRVWCRRARSRSDAAQKTAEYRRMDATFGDQMRKF
ncbi:MAG TPA: hypothetical protein H9794_04820 [Candidatus Mediterraneibacter merdigallinarum]|nr:hypothetical protein [Candidatus Mediterraneibacter merdigallinarum]